MKRCIVAGGRSFCDYRRVLGVLAGIRHKYGLITVLCGGAGGADSHGKAAAEALGHTVELFPADWDEHGRSAGIIRNLQMAHSADSLVAFWDGRSRGTKNMIETALENGLEVHVYRYENLGEG